MDLSYTPEQIAFRKEVRSWIESAMGSALKRVRDAARDVRLVTYSGKAA